MYNICLFFLLFVSSSLNVLCFCPVVVVVFLYVVPFMCCLPPPCLDNRMQISRVMVDDVNFDKRDKSDKEIVLKNDDNDDLKDDDFKRDEKKVVDIEAANNAMNTEKDGEDDHVFMCGTDHEFSKTCE